jgi:hypothetical protein
MKEEKQYIQRKTGQSLFIYDENYKPMNSINSKHKKFMKTVST